MSKPRRKAWWVVGALLAAGATAVAVAVATVPPAVPDAPSVASAQQILLATAVRAEQADDGTGAYWHRKIISSDGVVESWTTVDGRVWVREGEAGPAQPGARFAPDGTAIDPFSMAGIDMTVEQLRALPREPAALTAWIAEAVARSDLRTSAGPLTADQRRQTTIEALIALVSGLPAPPEVRAAAFRAIAAHPEVRSLGAVPGGEGLILGDGLRLVVDPATGQVRSTSVLAVGGGMMSTADGSAGITVETRWTDDLPDQG